MPNRILNFCYNIAAKREVNKKLKDGKYADLSGQTSMCPSPVASADMDEDSDSSSKSPNKLAFLNKLFKTKAKHSDDELSTSLEYQPPKMNENADDLSYSSRESNDGSKPVTGFVNRKKKRTLAFYDKMVCQQKKHSGWAKLSPVHGIPDINTNIGIEAGASSSNDSLIAPHPKPVGTLIECKEILEEFDPLWTDKALKEKPDSVRLEDILKVPVKPPRNKTTLEKAKKNTAFKLSEIKMAKLEAIQENEQSDEEQALETQKEENPEQLLIKAKVSYEGLEGVFAKPIIRDNSLDIKQGEIRVVSLDYNARAPVPVDLASASYSELQPVFNEPRKDLMIEDLLAEFDTSTSQTHQGTHQLFDDNYEGTSNKKNLLVQPLELDEAKEVYQPTEEEEIMNNRFITEFFAEEARSLEEADIVNYSDNIEISKIEIYEEDIKRYHQALKYRRGPIDHDVIFTTVETALNFIEKLTKERERKKKTSFIPEFIEKCLKSKTKKEEEEKKKKEKEAKKKKGPSKPKMWLVFNRYSKEKVIICAPAEFYDSE